ncbi:helix-turn-helix domain-containing protein [Salinibacter ruber]|jgi:transcriptional regulator with XRE-family HTH domain|uniref:helix-turn-helix domain-containing protein n=1 Tax=Salinibacter ruber TaxID=146919 RepID=UPI002451F45B|nr:transcriptional regulator with XRE-family HTH domain [Salinibacter ruber]
MAPEKIKEIRHRADLSQTELANIMSVDRSAVGQWEAGITQPGRTQRQVLKAIRRELNHRERKEWDKFLKRAAGSLSLALFMRWLSDN